MKKSWILICVFVIAACLLCCGAYASGVAGAEDMTAVEDVVEEWMTPIYGDALQDGVYAIDMDSSSSMFKVDHCELQVEQGELTAVLYMTSESYAYMFAGTAEEAAAAEGSDWIPLAEDEDGIRSFTLPIDALDAGEACAAFSVRKELWYDRTLVFRADSLPMDAFLEPRFATVESLGLDDGEYTVEVSLAGGSGRASVTSPAALTVEDGQAEAVIQWSSSKYDYMLVDDVKYEPINEEGNSTFRIPVTGFDYPMPVLADTTAMSVPYEIEYTLYFDAASIRAAGE